MGLYLRGIVERIPGRLASSKVMMETNDEEKREIERYTRTP